MRRILFIVPAFIFMLVAHSQPKISLNGYIKELGMFYKPMAPIAVSESDTLNSLSLNQFHNRLNFKWFATSELTVAVEARNRLFFGQMIERFPAYKDMVNTGDGFFNLATSLVSNKNWFLHSAIDRAWLDYTAGNWQFTAGRQRINWGINLVWNPNDIFNTFSYFEFDYEERPGTDGIKIQYYTGVTSSAQLVYKAGRSKQETAFAGMYRCLKGSYDLQFLGGRTGNDYVLGGGWSGDIKGGAFRGEFSYFHPADKNKAGGKALVASVSGDYTFKNSLYLHSAVLFNSIGKTGDAGGIRGFFEQNLTAKMLSVGMVNLFGQASYPFTPLFSGSFSSIVNPLDGSSFLGPTLTYSLGNNLEIMANGQLFTGRAGTEYGNYGKAVFARLKWSF